jgi:hypothetical protein
MSNPPYLAWSASIIVRDALLWAVQRPGYRPACLGDEQLIRGVRGGWGYIWVR